MEFSITHHVVITAVASSSLSSLKIAMICNLGNLFTFSELKKKVHSPLLLCYTKNMGCLQKRALNALTSANDAEKATCCEVAVKQALLRINSSTT